MKLIRFITGVTKKVSFVAKCVAILCIIGALATAYSGTTFNTETQIPLLGELKNLFNDSDNEVSQNGFHKASILETIDGDTILVMDSNTKKQLKVRLIGVNTPESVHSDEEKNCEEGKIASLYTKASLKTGMTVYLEYDVETDDQYGRTLAYVWLTDECNPSSYEDFCNFNYGALLLQNTYCEAVYYEPNGKYKEWYEKLDAEN